MAATRFGALLLLVAALVLAPAAAWADRRVALVIGIGAYRTLSPLANPVPDAEAIAGALRGQGYEVSEHYDLTRGDLLNALEDFQRAAEGADVALVYYAGHGMEVGGENILAPVDTEVTCEPRAARRSVEVEELFEALGRAKNQVVLLDACRDDPFPQCATRGARAGSGFRGLQRVVEPETSLVIANATLPGQLAADGAAGEHSPFAAALLARFASDAAAPLRDMLDRAARDVRRETGGSQVPEITTQGGAPDICLAAGCSATPPTTSPPPVVEAPPPAMTPETGGGEDRTAYEAAVAVGSCGALEAFARAFPQSFYAELARERAATACAPAPAPAEEQAAVAPQPPVERGYDEGFVFPDSSERRLSENELRPLSNWELRVARNEIFARNGRYFQSNDMLEHFGRFPWYQPHTWEPTLSDVEQYNVGLIQAEENRR
jgi:hypothetical protein